MERQKGKSLIALPASYTVVDVETTGLSTWYDEIIEVAAIRIRNGIIVDKYQSLVKPKNKVNEYVQELTGITNEMLLAAPTPVQIAEPFYKFLGDDIILGHNVNFDINFIYDLFEKQLGVIFNNDFVDTLRMARKVAPDLDDHRLCTLSEAFGIEDREFHRSFNDCIITNKIYNAIKEQIADVEAYINSFKKKHSVKVNLKDLVSIKQDFDETHLLYGKHCVFTGTLEKLTRVEAAQVVVNIGGICDNGVTKKTNFLILGNNDYCSTIKDGKSSKQKKAEEYKLKGQDIEVIDEYTFYDLISE